MGRIHVLSGQRGVITGMIRGGGDMTGDAENTRVQRDVITWRSEEVET